MSSTMKHTAIKNAPSTRIGRRAFLLLPPAASARANAAELKSENMYTFQSQNKKFALVMRIYENDQCVRLDKHIQWLDIVQHKQRLESETKLYLLDSHFV